MKLPVLYNEIEDEFTYDLTLAHRIKRYVDTYFYPIRCIALFTNVYLIGGAIRDLMFAIKPKDLDFVVMDDDNLDLIMDVLRKYNIQYTYNRFGGLKIHYNDIVVDLWTTNNILSAIQYNVDGLLFDIKSNSFISLTFDDFNKNGLKLINPDNNIENGRKEKLLTFERKYNEVK